MRHGHGAIEPGERHGEAVLGARRRMQEWWNIITHNVHALARNRVHQASLQSHSPRCTEFSLPAIANLQHSTDKGQKIGQHTIGTTPQERQPSAHQQTCLFMHPAVGAHQPAHTALSKQPPPPHDFTLRSSDRPKACARGIITGAVPQGHLPSAHQQPRLFMQPAIDAHEPANTTLPDLPLHQVFSPSVRPTYLMHAWHNHWAMQQEHLPQVPLSGSAHQPLCLVVHPAVGAHHHPQTSFPGCNSS